MRNDRLVNYLSGIGGGLYLANVLDALALDGVGIVRALIVFLGASIIYYRIYVRSYRPQLPPAPEPKGLTTIVEYTFVDPCAMTPSGDVAMCPFCPHPSHENRCGAAVVYIGQSQKEVVSRCKCRHEAACKLNAECYHTDADLSDHDCSNYIKLINIGAEAHGSQRHNTLTVLCEKCGCSAVEAILPQEAVHHGNVLMQHFNSGQLLPGSLSRQLGLGDAIQREQLVLRSQ